MATQLTQGDKRASREGYNFVVIVGGKRKCYTSTVKEAKKEAGASGRIVALSRMSYTARNPEAVKVGAKVGEYSKKGARAVGRGLAATGRGLKAAAKSTGRFFGGFAEGWKAHNPRTQPANEAEAHELVLYILNDEYLATRRFPEFAKNIATKLKRGKFDPTLAIKLLEYLTKEGATKYHKEFGKRFIRSFSPATRREAAAQLVPYAVELAQEQYL